MKRSPTLIDTLYRSSFKNVPVNGWSNNAKWRQVLTKARRFVLDDAMSTFLGELCTHAFLDRPAMNTEVRIRMAENLRVGARLPHETTWIEYNLRNSMVRSQELLGRKFDPLLSPKYEGWLLQQHPSIETAFIAHIVSHDPDTDHGDGCDTWTFPSAIAWTTDQDSVLPWHSPLFVEGRITPSEVATGVLGYKTNRATYVRSDLIVTPNKPKEVANLMQEWSGVLRRMWALLSTINDLPVQVTEVRQPKGFVARGQYRKFLDHSTITLTVPQKKYLSVARNALSMAHRRAHTVRQHLRLDWRHPLSPLCDHEFMCDDETHLTCTRCKGRKIWIKEHQRGSALYGFVSHDYSIRHDPD